MTCFYFGDLVPELIQKDLTPERVAAETLRLLDDGGPRATMLSDLEAVRAKLGGGGATAAAADQVMEFFTTG